MSPRAVFLAVLIGGMAVTESGPMPAAEEPNLPVITITAKRFEFTPKEVHLKKGETVVLRLVSEDVTHGLMTRALNLDVDIEPGKTTEARVTPMKAGRFTAICDHFCGSGHGNM
jgi:cytochrome c oxidase subunit 2